MRADAAHPCRAGIEADRHISAKPRRYRRQINRIEPPEPRKEPKRSRRVARPAANARGDGEIFFQGKRNAWDNVSRFREDPRGGKHQIFIQIPGQIPGKRAVNGEREISSRVSANSVPDIGKHRETIEKMITIRAPPDDVQVKIDLCPRTFGERPRRDQCADCRAVLSSAVLAMPLLARPACLSFAWIRAASSASGLNVSARCH